MVAGLGWILAGDGVPPRRNSAQVSQNKGVTFLPKITAYGICSFQETFAIKKSESRFLGNFANLRPKLNL